MYVVWSEGQVQAGEANEFNLEDISRQVGDRTMQMAGEGVKNALKEKAKIVDKRYNFF